MGTSQEERTACAKGLWQEGLKEGIVAGVESVGGPERYEIG